MKIVQLLPSLEFGGQERLALDLAVQQKVTGDEPYLYCTVRTGALAREAEAAGIPVRVFHKAPGFSPRLLYRMTAALRSDRPDVLHAHNSPVLPYAVMASWLTGSGALVHTRHGNPTTDAGTESIWKLLAGRTDKTVFVSEALRDHYVAACGLARAKTEVIYNGINLGRFLARAAPLNSDSKRFRFGTLGRFCAEKDQVSLVRAFARVSAAWPEAELHIMGDGPCRPAIMEAVQSLGVAQRMKVHDPVVEVNDFLASLDVFVLSSISEGLPIVLQESLAAGVPIVCTHLPGFTEMFPAGEMVWYCPPGDPEELARLMLEVGRRADLSAARARARRFALRFSIEETWRQYRSLYEDILARRWATTGVKANAGAEICVATNEVRGRNES